LAREPGGHSSDSQRRRSRAVGLCGTAEKSKKVRPSADCLRIRVDPFRERRSVGGDESHGLSGEAAEGTLVAAMAERRVLAGRAVIVDVSTEFRRVAEGRLKLCGDRRLIGAGEGWSRERGRGRGGEKLNDEREGNDDCRQRRTPRGAS
jgi:hypothetical protein